MSNRFVLSTFNDRCGSIEVALCYPNAFSGGQDGTIRRWCLVTSSCLQVLLAHQDAVRHSSSEWCAWLWLCFNAFKWSVASQAPHETLILILCRLKAISCLKSEGPWMWIGTRIICWLEVLTHPCACGPLILQMLVCGSSFARTTHQRRLDWGFKFQHNSIRFEEKNTVIHPHWALHFAQPLWCANLSMWGLCPGVWRPQKRQLQTLKSLKRGNTSYYCWTDRFNRYA